MRLGNRKRRLSWPNSTLLIEKIAKKAFAFPAKEKEPIENATHVRNAIARFNQVQGVSDSERDAAWKWIKAAAKKFDVEVKEKSWREIGCD